MDNNFTKEKGQALGYDVLPYGNGFMVKKEVNGVEMYTGASHKWYTKEDGIIKIPIMHLFLDEQKAWDFIQTETHHAVNYEQQI